MPTPDKPQNPRRRKATMRKQPTARKKTIRKSVQPNSRQTSIEAPLKARVKPGPVISGAPSPATPARRSRPSWRRMLAEWRARQRRTLDLNALPRVGESWHRRLRHRWRRSRLARRGVPWLIARLGAYARLTRINRPIGTFLLLWPTLWALWLASDGHPAPWLFVVFVLGTFLMRSAGCAINDFADRRIDSHVRRTRARPLARGEIHPVEALAVFAVLSLAALALVLTLNRLTLWLALPGVFFAVTYPFMKRFTQLPQLYLGIAFGWGIPMAFAAVTGHVPPVAWLLLIINILWATAYDTMYAMADRPDDVKIGVKSTAILFGEMDRVIVGMLQVTVLIGLALAGLRLHLAPVYYWSLGAAACFSLYQQWLIRDRDPQRCFQAFMNNNWFGAAVFAGILLQLTFVH